MVSTSQWEIQNNWLEKKEQNPSLRCFHEVPFKESHHPLAKKQEDIFQANGIKKQAGTPILISNKIDFKPKLVRTGKNTAYSSKEKSTKRTLHFVTSMSQTQRHTSLLKNKTTKKILQIKSYIDPHTLIMGDFNTPLYFTLMNRTNHEDKNKTKK